MLSIEPIHLLLILFLPFIGFVLTILFTKYSKKAYYIELAAIVLTFLLSVYIAFVKLFYLTDSTSVFEFTWISLPVISSVGFNIKLGFEVENNTVLMLIVVNLISMLVHFYSIEYMKGDKRYNRYFAYLGLFTFSMLGIVLTHNLLMMYIFWELVGLSSFLLIGFWFEKESAANAAKKAFLANRIGDIGMFLGILILFYNYNTFTFHEIFDQIKQGNLPFNSGLWLSASGILIFMGAIGKSAQFPLHVWLPDAMEGPTPVSALIHAATMVAAGVFLLTKIFVLLTADAMLTIAVIGGITAVISAFTALTQNDIKKVLAYSTISQLGYMVMAIGVGAYKFALLHLITHAFFKACLFLGSGSVIHAAHHEQDIRKMGGFRKKMPITYITFLIASLSLSGFPLFSGFLSKDGILAGSLGFAVLTGHWMLPIFGFSVAALTAFYMFRLIILTFHGEPRDTHVFEHLHESPKLMTVPLIILSTLSIFLFYSFNPLTAEGNFFYNNWIETREQIIPEELRWEFMTEHNSHNTNETEHHDLDKEHNIKSDEIVFSNKYTHTMHSIHYPALITSLIMALSGFAIALFIYGKKKKFAAESEEGKDIVYKTSLNKMYFDEIYEKVFVNGLLGLSKVLNYFDSKIVDGVVNLSATFTLMISRLSELFDTYVIDALVNFTALLSGFFGMTFRRIQNGKIQTYIAITIVSLIIIIFFVIPF